MPTSKHSRPASPCRGKRAAWQPRLRHPRPWPQLRLRPAALLQLPHLLPPHAAISADVQKMVDAGKKWSKSSIAAEQARRKRNNLPALNDAEVPRCWASRCRGSSTGRSDCRSRSRVPPQLHRLPRLHASAASSVARTAENRRTYVGTPAVGTSESCRCRRHFGASAPRIPTSISSRRRFAWACVAASYRMVLGVLPLLPAADSV